MIRLAFALVMGLCFSRELAAQHPVEMEDLLALSHQAAKFDVPGGVAKQPGQLSDALRRAAWSAPAGAASLGDSIRRVASHAPAAPGHRMPKGFLWTGVSLVGYGGFLFGLGLGYGPAIILDCPRGDCRECVSADCPYTQDVLFKGAARFVAGGAAVLGVGALIGASQSTAAPRITVHRRGFAVQQAVPDRLWRRLAPGRR